MYLGCIPRAIGRYLHYLKHMGHKEALFRAYNEVVQVLVNRVLRQYLETGVSTEKLTWPTITAATWGVHVGGQLPTLVNASMVYRNDVRNTAIAGNALFTSVSTRHALLRVLFGLGLAHSMHCNLPPHTLARYSLGITRGALRTTAHECTVVGTTAAPTLVGLQPSRTYVRCMSRRLLGRARARPYMLNCPSRALSAQSAEPEGAGPTPTSSQSTLRIIIHQSPRSLGLCQALHACLGPLRAELSRSGRLGGGVSRRCCTAPRRW